MLLSSQNSRFTINHLIIIIGMMMLSVVMWSERIIVGSHKEPDVTAIEEQITSLNTLTNSFMRQWLIAEDSARQDNIIATGVPQSWQQKGISVYLLQNDSIVYWSNHNFTTDITPTLLRPASKSIVEIGQWQGVVMPMQMAGNNRSAVLLITLSDTKGANKYIFGNTNPHILPYGNSSETMVVHFQKWSFWVQYNTINNLPTLWIVMGWLAVMCILLSGIRLLERLTKRDNALVMSLTALLILATIRFALFFSQSELFTGQSLYQTLDIPSTQLWSPANLYITLLFVFILFLYCYRIRQKIRWHYLSLSRNNRLVMMVITILLINLNVLLFHWTVVKIIYDQSVNVEFYNLFEIKPNTVIFYFICALFVTLRIIQNKFFSTIFTNIKFRWQYAVSLSLMLLVSLPVWGELYGTGWLLLGFHAIFTLVASRREKTSYGIQFLVTITVFALYISILTIRESSSANNQTAKRLIHEISQSTFDQDILKAPQYQKMTYAIIDQYNIVLGESNSFDIQTLLPVLTANKDTLATFGSYRHLMRPLDDGRKIIVSYPYTTPLDAASLFSYLFMMLYLVVDLLLRLTGYRTSNGHFTWRSLTVRIRVVVVGVVIFSMGSVTWMVVNYSIENYHKSQRLLINSTVRDVLTSFNNYASSTPHNDSTILQQWYHQQWTTKNSNVNLYNTSGRLVASADSAHTPSLMNSQARHLLAELSVPLYNIQNTAGESPSLTSTFIPLFVKQRNVGFINFVSYDPTNLHVRYRLLSELLNLFMVVLFVSLLLSALLYRMITRPIERVHAALSNIGQMQKIPTSNTGPTNADDEIGLLVAGYNKMIDYLEASYVALARSEREGAWREMARQVAHEIKNPLTPMRLRIQMLQRGRAQQLNDIDKRTDDTLNLLLEQIDILSNIATEFADFAKMSDGAPSPIDIGLLLDNIVRLYSSNSDTIMVSLNNNTCNNVWVEADYQQLHRVFVNLLQNAVQALNTRSCGIIDINIYPMENSIVRIDISDNGTGISEEVADKIFMPNFTTKSAGSGLGLAMSRKIIENVGGTITFESTQGQGTTFSITLPLMP